MFLVLMRHMEQAKKVTNFHYKAERVACSFHVELSDQAFLEVRFKIAVFLNVGN